MASDVLMKAILLHIEKHGGKIDLPVLTVEIYGEDSEWTRRRIDAILVEMRELDLITAVI